MNFNNHYLKYKGYHEKSFNVQHDVNAVGMRLLCM